MIKFNEYKDEKTEDNCKSASIEINKNEFTENKYHYDYKLGISKINKFDYLILIKKISFLGIKYFVFGNTIHIYQCNCLKKSQYKLSEVPTPFLTLGPECKLEI